MSFLDDSVEGRKLLEQYLKKVTGGSQRVYRSEIQQFFDFPGLDLWYRQPFDLIAQTLATDEKKRAENKPFSARNEIWLPGPDSNQRQGG